MPGKSSPRSWTVRSRVLWRSHVLEALPMIDLGRGKAELLADIEAGDAPETRWSDITGLRVASSEGRIFFCGRSREALFPLLRLSLAERFDAIPRMELNRDLLVPLKNAIGNAFKHGNRRDLTKWVVVEMVLGRQGLLIT